MGGLAEHQPADGGSIENAAGEQVCEIPYAEKGKPVHGPTVWYGKDLTPELVNFRLTATHRQELDEAVKAVQGLAIQEITIDDFSLPTLGPALDKVHREVIYGNGMRILQNLPGSHDASLEYTARALWIVSCFFGNQVSLNQTGHLIEQLKHSDRLLQVFKGHRTNMANSKMGFHNDNADIVLLHCMQQAPEGGESSCISAHALHNEILARRPDLYEVLCRPFYQDRGDWWPEGTPPYYISPFFHFHNNTLGVEAVTNIEAAEQFPGVPRVRPEQQEALLFAHSVAEEEKLRYNHLLHPGECLINQNVTTWHARGNWKDSDTQKRWMLRVWCASPLGWPLDPLYAERWQSVEIGNRGGVNVPGTKEHVTLDYDCYVDEFESWFKSHPNATTTHLKTKTGGGGAGNPFDAQQIA